MLEELKKMKWYDQLFCALPIGLVVVGGAIGGVFGALAFTLNIKVFSKELSSLKKYIFTLLITLGSVILYLVIIIVLALLFPGIFG